MSAPKGNKFALGNKGGHGKKIMLSNEKLKEKLEKVFFKGISFEDFEKIAKKIKLTEFIVKNQSKKETVVERKEANKKLNIFDIYIYRAITGNEKILIDLINKMCGVKGDDTNNNNITVNLLNYKNGNNNLLLVNKDKPKIIKQ